MTRCDLDVVLYFYDELDAGERVRAAAHVGTCETCRQRLEDLHAIRRALAARPVVDAPASGEWSGFMHRLDVAVGATRSGARLPTEGSQSTSGPAHQRLNVSAARQVLALAAVLLVVVTGVFMAARFRASSSAVTSAPDLAAGSPPSSAAASANLQSLREVSAEHFERSKLVVLGLTSRDPEQTTPEDWQYERRLAATLLSDTRLYRLAAQDRGVTDVARVLRDLETVLLEASLSDTSDGHALERVQRLIAKRDLVMKMQVIATTDSAGI